MAHEDLRLEGHIIDSLILTKVLDDIVNAGARYEIVEFNVGETERDPSAAVVRVTSDTQEELQELALRLQRHGANPLHTEPASAERAPADGVFPDDFYSTTNLDTEVLADGGWQPVAGPEMDCGVLLRDGEARTIPMLDVRAGDPIVVGQEGVRTIPVERPRGAQVFEFMSSGVSTEKPKHLVVQEVAHQMREVREQGRPILFVGGPAVVHTGASPALERIIAAGYVQELFAGNALPAHDLEQALYSTSLGISLESGQGVQGGHAHHIRAINTIRAAGGIAAAVKQGVVTSGIMHACTVHDVRTTLAGSVRDDGPLPEVVTDMVEAQRLMRERARGVGLGLMVATMLHSIATGNLLPASTPLICVDINPATVTKLVDRGSQQAIGVVTDVGLFLADLADELGA